MPTTVRDQAEHLYAEWQLRARQRGRLHDFLRAIARARAAADVADRMGRDIWSRLAPTAEAALAEARQLLVLAAR